MSLLTEMDGIEELNGVVVLAATNRPDVIVSRLFASLTRRTCPSPVATLLQLADSLFERFRTLR